MDTSRVSVCTIPLIDRQLGSALDVISQAGFTKIDLLGRLPHLSVDPGQCDYDAVERMVVERGMHIANLGTYAGSSFASESEDEREAGLLDLRNTIDLAVRFGARSIRVMAGRPEDPDLIDRIVPYYQRGAEYAERKTIYMGIENYSGPIAGSPQLLVRLAERVGSRYFGVLYEPVNLMSAGVEYRSAFEVMRDHITHVHLKDGKYVEGKWQYTMLGEGEIDLRWVIDRLVAVGYDGTFALEYEVNRIEPPETGLAKWHAVWESI